MKTIKLNEVPAAVLESPEVRGVRKQVPVGVADGTPTMSLRVFTVEPGGYTPFHAHPWEHINYILAGEGELLNEAGERRAIAAGDYALVLPDEMHQFRNTGDSELQFICLVPRDHE